MNLGDKVIIKECHSVATLVGKQAHVVALLDAEFFKYDLMVALYEPLRIESDLESPIGTMKFVSPPTLGPFSFRSDEVELFQAIPDAFKKALDEKPPEETDT